MGFLQTLPLNQSLNPIENLSSVLWTGGDAAEPASSSAETPVEPPPAMPALEIRGWTWDESGRKTLVGAHWGPR